MYSLVLMAALTSPATTLDCHKTQCSGCTGASCWGSCSGSCYGSCHGSRCSGCWGSCSGSYYSSCSGCYGSSCWGSSCSGSCSGCYGSAYYYSGSCYGGHSCYGCSGSCSGCYGTSTSAYPPSFEYTQPAAPAAPATKPPTSMNNSPAPAVVSIALPADAKLYVDGQLTKTMDKAVRTFATPELENGQEYRYTMKAEVVRDGIVQSETKTVIVKAGAEIRESFDSLNDIKTASNR